MEYFGDQKEYEMKAPEEWYNAFLVNKSPDGDLDMIEQIQKEAWNEAIEAAAESAKAEWSGMAKVWVDKESILKLKK